MNRKILITRFAIVATLTAQAQTTHHPDLSANVACQVAKVRAANSDSTHRNTYQPDWNSLAQYRAPGGFRYAKFGIFIHWGVCAVPAFGNEWYSINMYVATSVHRQSSATKTSSPCSAPSTSTPNARLDLFKQAEEEDFVLVGPARM